MLQIIGDTVTINFDEADDYSPKNIKVFVHGSATLLGDRILTNEFNGIKIGDEVRHENTPSAISGTVECFFFHDYCKESDGSPVIGARYIHGGWDKANLLRKA